MAKYTEEQLLRIRCNEAMQVFNHTQRREAKIWASKHRKCPNCEQPPHQPCLNKVDLNEGKPPERCRVNKQPHDERIDWQRLEDGLERRGYFKGAWKGTRS